VQRLSSGLRINSAADDAAGLAVREMMRVGIAVLNQGVRNANDAISLIQTADGALSVIDEKLTRMKELAEQASTGTYTSAQRLIMDSEFQAMASEITRIATATDFNGVKLLDGSLSGTGLDGGSGNQMKIHFGTGNSSAEDYYYIKISGATTSALGLTGVTEAGFVAKNGLVLDATDLLGNYWQYTEASPSVQDRFDPTQTSNGYTGNGLYYVFARDHAGDLHVLSSTPFPPGSTVTDTNLRACINFQDQAQQALEKIDSAIVSKDNIRANLGAMANRLANTISNQSIQAQNLQAAESRISDVDVATEMTEFTREQILVQASVSMLAQANSLPQLALKLIGA
jgi:flagellin